MKNEFEFEKVGFADVREGDIIQALGTYRGPARALVEQRNGQRLIVLRTQIVAGDMPMHRVEIDAMRWTMDGIWVRYKSL